MGQYVFGSSYILIVVLSTARLSSLCIRALFEERGNGEVRSRNTIVRSRILMKVAIFVHTPDIVNLHCNRLETLVIPRKRSGQVVERTTMVIVSMAIEDIWISDGASESFMLFLFTENFQLMKSWKQISVEGHVLRHMLLPKLWSSLPTDKITRSTALLSFLIADYSLLPERHHDHIRPRVQWPFPHVSSTGINSFSLVPHHDPPWSSRTTTT